MTRLTVTLLLASLLASAAGCKKDGASGSGAGSITVGFGDGTRGRVPTKTGVIKHRYRGAGRYPYAVSVEDKAGNRGAATGMVRAG